MIVPSAECIPYTKLTIASQQRILFVLAGSPYIDSRFNFSSVSTSSKAWLLNHFTAKGGQIRAKLEKNPTKFQMPLYWPRPWQLYFLLYEWNLQIKSHITCNTFNVIYVIQCRLCNLQYIGKTSRVSLSPRAPTTSKRLPRRQWNIIVCQQLLTFVWTEYSPYITWWTSHTRLGRIRVGGEGGGAKLLSL